MKRTLGAAMLLSVAAIMPAQEAAAQDPVAGAIVGGALAGPGYYGYYGDPYYGGPYAYGGCYRQRVWTPYGWRWHRVCGY